VHICDIVYRCHGDSEGGVQTCCTGASHSFSASVSQSLSPSSSGRASGSVRRPCPASRPDQQREGNAGAPGASSDMEETLRSGKAPKSPAEHKTSAMSVFNELRLEGKLCDAVVKASGVEFRVHRVILMHCAPYTTCSRRPFRQEFHAIGTFSA
ncbi:hypothetical protein Z043_126012, partial [Scleropages formosus]